MKLKDLKHNFSTRLSSSYSIEEVESMFFLLAEHRLNLKRIDFILNSDIEITKENQSYFKKTIENLLKEIPIQYIIGEAHFYGMKFNVNSNVLIPRQETEELVDWIIKDTNQLKKEKITILDIGTGSGCIAISLAKHIKNAQVYAIDISKEALKVAQTNASKNNINVNFAHENILTCNSLTQKFDIIVSNPPYVRELEKNEIKKNVLENEPHLALFVNDQNPLLFYDAIGNFAKKNLTQNGVLYFEINQYLGIETLNLIKDKGFTSIKLKKDLNNNNRMLKSF